MNASTYGADTVLTKALRAAAEALLARPGRGNRSDRQGWLARSRADRVRPAARRAAVLSEPQGGSHRNPEADPLAVRVESDVVGGPSVSPTPHAVPRRDAERCHGRGSRRYPVGSG